MTIEVRMWRKDRVPKKLRYASQVIPDEGSLPFKVMSPDVTTQTLVISARFLNEDDAIAYARLLDERVGMCLCCNKVYKKPRRDSEYCGKACRHKLYRERKLGRR